MFFSRRTLRGHTPICDEISKKTHYNGSNRWVGEPVVRYTRTVRSRRRSAPLQNRIQQYLPTYLPTCTLCATIIIALFERENTARNSVDWKKKKTRTSLYFFPSFAEVKIIIIPDTIGNKVQSRSPRQTVTLLLHARVYEFPDFNGATAMFAIVYINKSLTRLSPTEFFFHLSNVRWPLFIKEGEFRKLQK